jgi:hypothetical protein
MQQVRQSVMIANDLVAQFQAIASKLAAAAAGTDDSELPQLRAEAERVYAGIWEQLDAAAALTCAVGRSIESYSAIRSSPDLEAHIGIGDVTSEVIGIESGARHDIVTVEGSVTTNSRGLAHARRAIQALQAVWPDVDWTPAAPPSEVDLRPRGLLSRLFGRR